MPGLVKKMLICATADGLFLHPVSSREHSVCISYGNHAIASATRSDNNSVAEKSVEVHGLVGLLDLVSSSYLVTITGREQVAQIRGKPVYTIKDVTLIPLLSQTEAEKAITQAQKSLKQGHPTGDQTEESDVEEDDHGDHSVAEDNEPTPEAAALEPPKPGPLKKSTTFVKNVVQEKGNYGRFATKWFSKSGWNASGRKQQGMSEEDNLTKEQEVQAAEVLPKDDSNVPAEVGKKDEELVTEHEEEARSTDKKAEAKKQSVLDSLTPRILRSVKLYFSASGFFFSYEHDLSGTLMQRDNSSTSVPLWKQYDELYFWNRHLAQPLIDAGQDALVLPMIQGFVGQRAFSITRTDSGEQDVVAEAVQKPEEVIAAQDSSKAAEPAQDAAKPSESKQEDYLLTLISRRSIKRAGLRYLRRGIDDEGNVANSVETEQMLSPQDWNSSAKTFSLLQYRGSIPLFFSQTPYSFKPLPVLFGSVSSNQEAFSKHFSSIQKRYGAVQAASLIDKHGTEVTAGETYEKHAKLSNEHGGADGKQLAFEWFDFHSQCKGMKFENVSILLDTLQTSLKSFGWIVKQENRNIQQQTGIVRTNCMDCLDRTNVVQSAIGGWALEQQLAELGLNIDLKRDPKTQWFNTLWADNGDSISKQYAGTSALKGDFTRTRKRNWTGALSDFSLTLNRYYNNIFGDYFLQLNIDYLLGNVGPTAFDDFEADMLNQDYALDMRRVRQNAIDTCVKIVLEDPKEDLVAGWTLSCPKEANTLRALPFEECVLLLTDAALYFCRFDWDAEKVGSFERVDLADVNGIWRGAYITSTLGPTHTDESRNVGFALRYKTHGQAMVRTNTRSLNNEEVAEDENKGKDELEKQKQPEKAESRLLAFKALPPKETAVKQGDADSDDQPSKLSEVEMIKQVCDEVHKIMVAVVKKNSGMDHLELEKVAAVEEKDVVSLMEARKSTGYMESIGYSLKKLVWS